MNILLRETTLQPDHLIQLQKGDITISDVDVIVNPANSKLVHGGGLAGILSRKAGPILQDESFQWVIKNGPVSHEAPAYTTAGVLPFRYIIHAVGPVWGSGQEENKLMAAIRGALHLASDLKAQSIAVPAISTGIFGFPLAGAARVLISGIYEFCEVNPESCLKTIQLVVFDDQAASIFREVWDKIQS